MPDDIKDGKTLVADLRELQKHHPELKPGYQEFQRTFRVYEALVKQFELGNAPKDVSTDLLHKPV